MTSFPCLIYWPGRLLVLGRQVFTLESGVRFSVGLFLGSRRGAIPLAVINGLGLGLSAPYRLVLNSSTLPMNNDFKKKVDEEKKHCQEQVASWQRKLEEAKSQLKYWEMQLDATSTLSTRLMLESWKTET